MKLSWTAAGPRSSLPKVHDFVQFHDLPQPIQPWRNATFGTHAYRVSVSRDNADPELGKVQNHPFLGLTLESLNGNMSSRSRGDPTRHLQVNGNRLNPWKIAV